MNLKRKLAGLAVAAVVALAAPAFADDAAEIKALREQIEALDQKVRALERKRELEVEEATVKSKNAPQISIGQNGFALRSADTNFVIRFRGLVQLDSRTFINDNPSSLGNDGFFLRRARLIFEGTVFRDFDFALVPEFGGIGTPSILDAYLSYRYAPELQLRAGKFKQPVGLERLQSDNWTFFVERGFPSQLTADRDLGLMLHGDVGDGLLTYAAGVFNGIGDNRSAGGLILDDQKHFAGRVFVQPFLHGDVKALRGLGVGIGGSFGNAKTAAGLPANGGYLSDALQPWFSYLSGTGTNANVTAYGQQWRIAPQASWYFGPFGLIGEYTISSQELRRTEGPTAAPTVDLRSVKNTAWQVAAGWVLTGEDSSPKGVTPRRNFDPRSGAWGAWELVARYGVLDVDDAVFAGARPFANPANSASKDTGWGVGLNWYLNRNLRASLDYFHDEFEGGKTGTNPVTKQNENALVSRIQLAF
ncbi:MAG: porin [Verrucomicrobia bacterium]|nr:MAG: porin [Verrucomicrobiota bacterium]